MNIRGFLAIATVALALTSVAGTAADRQQSQTSPAYATISGRVEIASDNPRAPLRRAAVTLRSESGTLTKTTATDVNGAYRFDGLAAGNYRVSAEKAGFLITSPGMDSRNAFPEWSLALGSQVILNFSAERAAALEGRLIEDTGRRIADLAVTAERLTDERGRPTAQSYSAKTDDLGRFRIHTLPAGRYRISAKPPSPASGALLYFPGAEKIEDAAILEVAAGLTMDNLTFVVATGLLPAMAAEAMANQELDAQSTPTRGGTWGQITGRVTRADFGQPIANAAVKLSSSGGVLLRTAWTDGAGEYSFRRVMAGNYQLAASADGYASVTAVNARVTLSDGERLKKELSLVALSAIEGRVVDEFGEPAPGVFLRVTPQGTIVNRPEVRSPPMPTAVTDDRGWFRMSSLLSGDYYVVALPEPFARSGPAAFPITIAPLQLVAGNDVHGLSVVLPTVSTSAISGTVTDTAGRRMPKALVTLRPEIEGPPATIPRADATADTNGNFVFSYVPAGTYAVEARASAYETGSVTITTPVEPFALAVKPLPTARGRVIFEGGVPPVIKPGIEEALLRHSFLRFQPAGTTIDEIIQARPGVVEPEWTFRIAGLSTSGLIRTNEGLLGWYLSKVFAQGRDITDVPIDPQAGDVEGIEVVLTKRVGGITGTVDDFNGDPIAVLVFGADGDSWPYLSRTFRGVAPRNQTGAFTVSGLLPGRYFVIAVRSGTPRSTPEALAALRPLATQVIVTEGADTPVRLSIVK